MKPYTEISCYAIVHPLLGPPIPNQGGAFRFRGMNVIASWADSWDHISVSRPDRCPTWEEMEQVKRAFFLSHETAMQLHVPPTDHKNLHPYCLHLWRPHDAHIPRPPSWMVA
ncbi:hypothetical protein QCN27_12465 [Cereibacter sp. SYSU M97828]|nr:hypothetical protein [Cereibacter flavus]